MNINTNKVSALPETGFMRLPQILGFIPVSKSTFWLRVKQGKFPKGIKLSSQITAWKVEDIRQLIEELGQGKSE